MNLMHIDIVTVNPCTISCGNRMKLRKSKKLSFTTGKEGPMGQASWLRLPWLHWELPANIPGSTLVKTWHWWHHKNQWDALLQTVPAHRTAICQPPDRATTCIGDSVWPKSSGPTGGCHHQKSPEITDLRCKHMFRAFRVTKTPFRKYHQATSVVRSRSFLLELFLCRRSSQLPCPKSQGQLRIGSLRNDWVWEMHHVFTEN